MAIKIGNIFNKSNLTVATNRVLGAASENLAGAFSLGGGLKAIGKSVLDEAFGGNSSINRSSPYPLGEEWQPDPAYVVNIQFTDPNTQQITTVQGYMPETISIGLGAEFSSPLESIGESMSSGAIGATARMFGYKVSANFFSMLLWSGSSHVDLTLELRFVALADTYEDVILPIRKLSSLVTPTIESFSVTPGPVQLGMVKAPGPSLEYVGTSSPVELAGQVTGEVVNAVGQAGSSLVNNAEDLITGETTAGQAVVNLAGATVSSAGAAVNQILKDLRVKNNISMTLGQFSYFKSIVVKDVSAAYNVKADDDGNWTDATVSVQISTFISPTNVDIPDLVGYAYGNASAALDPTAVDSDLATLAGGGIAGGLTKMGGVTDKLKESLGNNSILSVKLPTVDDALKKLNVAPQTTVAPVLDNLYDNLASIGKDVGLASKVVSGANNFTLGMSEADIANFNKNLIKI